MITSTGKCCYSSLAIGEKTISESWSLQVEKLSVIPDFSTVPLRYIAPLNSTFMSLAPSMGVILKQLG